MDVEAIYHGSDGEATTRLYRALERVGPIGIVACNLFRAQKCSERAKKYRGGIRGKGSYRQMAYDRKNWSIENLSAVLETHAESLQITWGWKIDAAKAPSDPFRWVLYVDTPYGQVSFHGSRRLGGPAYPYEWDRMGGIGHSRVIAFCEWVLKTCSDVIDETPTTTPSPPNLNDTAMSSSTRPVADPPGSPT